MGSCSGCSSIGAGTQAWLSTRSPRIPTRDQVARRWSPLCFYYGFTGLACVVYYRHELFKSVRKFVLLGLAPLTGALMLFGVFGKAAEYYGHKANVESPPIAGITLPLWLGVGGLALGFALMLLSRPYFREFFSRKTETAPPALLEQPVEHAPAHF